MDYTTCGISEKLIPNKLITNYVNKACKQLLRKILELYIIKIYEIIETRNEVLWHV
jgi:hypothetical protein